MSPRFILLDEPFAGIDPIAVTDIQQIIFHLKARGIGVLITDHNVRETLRITDRAYIVNDGVIFKSGTPGELAADEEVRRIYLGHRLPPGLTASGLAASSAESWHDFRHGLLESGGGHGARSGRPPAHRPWPFTRSSRRSSRRSSS